MQIVANCEELRWKETSTLDRKWGRERGRKMPGSISCQGGRGSRKGSDPLGAEAADAGPPQERGPGAVDVPRPATPEGGGNSQTHTHTHVAANGALGEQPLQQLLKYEEFENRMGEKYDRKKI